MQQDTQTVAQDPDVRYNLQKYVPQYDALQPVEYLSPMRLLLLQPRQQAGLLQAPVHKLHRLRQSHLMLSLLH